MSTCRAFSTEHATGKPARASTYGAKFKGRNAPYHLYPLAKKELRIRFRSTPESGDRFAVVFTLRGALPAPQGRDEVSLFKLLLIQKTLLMRYSFAMNASLALDLINKEPVARPTRTTGSLCIWSTSPKDQQCSRERERAFTEPTIKHVSMTEIFLNAYRLAQSLLQKTVHLCSLITSALRAMKTYLTCFQNRVDVLTLPSIVAAPFSEQGI